jgi:hypothetical protein
MVNNLIDKLMANVGNARYFIMKSGENIPARIEKVDESNRVVQYINRQGLRALQEAQRTRIPTERILNSQLHYSAVSFDDIVDFN